MRVFLTGGTGFIGGALARRLAGAGDDVVGLARDPTRAPGILGVRWVAGDLGRRGDWSPEALESLAAAEAVAHLGAVRKDWALTDDELREVNVDAGPWLLERARSASRLLFVSSVAVHGHPEGDRPADETAPIEPSKRYGLSKAEAERVLRVAIAARQEAAAPASSRGSVPDLVVARPGITYGPGDTYGMVANMARLIAGRRFLLVGSGRSRVNLLHVDDLAEALARALSEPAAAGQTLLLAGPEPVEIRELARLLANALGRRLPLVRAPEALVRAAAFVLERVWPLLGRRSEPFVTKAKVDLLTRSDLWDVGRARRVLGFEPERELASGLCETVTWLSEQGELGEAGADARKGSRAGDST